MPWKGSKKVVKSNKPKQSTTTAPLDSERPKQKSKYLLSIRGGRKGRRKKFDNNTNSAWLKTRHRVRKKILR